MAIDSDFSHKQHDIFHGYVTVYQRVWLFSSNGAHKMPLWMLISPVWKFRRELDPSPSHHIWPVLPVPSAVPRRVLSPPLQQWHRKHPWRFFWDGTKRPQALDFIHFHPTWGVHHENHQQIHDKLEFNMIYPLVNMVNKRWTHPVFYSWVNPRFRLGHGFKFAFIWIIPDHPGSLERWSRPTSWGCPVWSPTPGRKPQRNHNAPWLCGKKNPHLIIFQTGNHRFYHGFLLWQVNIDEYVDHKQIISRSSTSKGNHKIPRCIYICCTAEGKPR